jgi:hypothetical protein
MTERPPLTGEVNAKFAAKGCRVISVTDPYGHILDFLDHSPHVFFQVSPSVSLGIETGPLDL